MRLSTATLMFMLSLLTARAEDRLFVGFGAGPQSGNGLHLGMIRGSHAVDFGLGLLYDSQDAKWGYSSGLRYMKYLYQGSVNDTYAWGGGALTGNYRDQTASHVTSVGAGLGVAFHFGLPIQIYFDSGLAGYFSEGFDKKEYFPAYNGGIRYVW
jgi:hypothetical protein